MKILENAVTSIQLGIEDYNSEDNKRLISCVRNLFAGILLLFKQKLFELSPEGSNEVLIKEKVSCKQNTNNELVWIGIGKNTVKIDQIKDRFKELKIDVEWKRIDKIRKFRNEIEHYYSELNDSAIQGMISDSFIVIRDFIKNYLNKDSLVLLGSETWNTLIEVDEVYRKEKVECLKALNEYKWDSDVCKDAVSEYLCSKCGSGLIEIIDNSNIEKFRCRSCGVVFDFEDIVESSIREYYSFENYHSVKHGGDPVCCTCPNCLRETYHVEDNICFICNESVDRNCLVCGVETPLEELDSSGVCGWCRRND